MCGDCWSDLWFPSSNTAKPKSNNIFFACRIFKQTKSKRADDDDEEGSAVSARTTAYVFARVEEVERMLSSDGTCMLAMHHYNRSLGCSLKSINVRQDLAQALQGRYQIHTHTHAHIA